MANTDAWGAAGGILFDQRDAGQTQCNQSQPLRISRFLSAEQRFRLLFTLLVVLFLGLLAFARLISLNASYQDAERNNRAAMSLAVGELSASLSRSDDREETLARVRERGLMSDSYVMLVLDEQLNVVASDPAEAGWVGRPFADFAVNSELLYTFERNAGVVEVIIDGKGWFAVLSRNPDRSQASAILVPRDTVFEKWHSDVKFNIVVFLLTCAALVLLVRGYHKQTARVRSADALYQQTHQRIELALVRGRCGLWDWDMARGRMYWSRSMHEMLGYAPSDHVLSFGDVDALVHPDDEDLYTIAQRVAARETDHIDQVLRMRHADGSWVWVRARAQVVDPDADELHLIGIAVDVSEQHLLAVRSETADMRLGAAVECLAESFVLWDSRNRIVLCNDRFQKDLGLSDEDVKPGTPREVIEARQVPFHLERRLASPQGPRTGAFYERQLADGRWLQVTELKTPDGGVVAIGADITQLKQNQDKLVDGERRLMATIHDLHVARKAEVERTQQLEKETERAEAASRAKSEFLANMSHELRTPLNAIIGFSEIMASGHFGPLGSDRYVEYANDIHGSGEHLLGVINDILDMAKIEAGQVSLDRKQIDLGPLISETVRVVAVQANAKDIKLNTHISDSMSIFADRRAIKQIVLNLLSNAVKFTPEGGIISIRARQTSTALILTIEDNGCGIPKAALKKLGRPFEQVQNQFSRNHEGSGLGLAISRSLAEMHGGALKIRSTEGQGTIVSVRVPMRKPVHKRPVLKVAA